MKDLAGKDLAGKDLAAWRREGKENVMGKILMNENGRPLRCDEIYRLLGVEGNRLPDVGVEPTLVQGILMYVEPKISGKAQDASRTKAQCPVCERWFVFDNLRQHIKIHR